MQSKPNLFPPKNLLIFASWNAGIGLKILLMRTTDSFIDQSTQRRAVPCWSVICSLSPSRVVGILEAFFISDRIPDRCLHKQKRPFSFFSHYHKRRTCSDKVDAYWHDMIWYIHKEYHGSNSLPFHPVAHSGTELLRLSQCGAQLVAAFSACDLRSSDAMSA